MFAKTVPQRQSVVHRGIIAGLSNVIAGARDSSFERAPPVPTTVLHAHVTQNLKGLGSLDQKLAKGGVLTGLVPIREASPDPTKKKAKAIKSARGPPKTLQQRLMVPLKDSARSKGKKTKKKKKKSSADIPAYVEEQDAEVSTTQNEETKNAISEAPADDEEATDEDQNIQQQSHDWGGGSGEVQQPAHGAHPSFAPGDAQSMLLIQDQRYHSDDKGGHDQDAYYEYGADSRDRGEHDGQDIGHLDGSDPGADTSEGAAGGRQPDSSEDEADFGDMPDRFAAGSYRAESLDGSRLAAQAAESYARSKDMSQDIAADPTGDHENEEAAGTEDQGVDQAPQRYLEEISQHDIARPQAPEQEESSPEEMKHSESERSSRQEGSMSKASKKNLSKYLMGNQKQSIDGDASPSIQDPKHESMLADKRAHGDEQEQESGDPHKAADEQMFALRDQISDTFRKLEAAEAQAQVAGAPPRPETLLVASKQASARARRENQPGSRMGKAGTGDDSQALAGDLSAELGLGARSYATEKSKQILMRKQPERLPMYSKQRIEQETLRFHQRKLENAAQKEALAKAAQLEEEQYMQAHSRSQKKAKFDPVQFGLDYQKKLAQAEARKKEREWRAEEQRFGAAGNNFQPTLTANAAGRVWVDPDRPKLEDRAHDELRKRRENVERLALDRAIQQQYALNAAKEVLQKSKQGTLAATGSGSYRAMASATADGRANGTRGTETKSVVMSQFAQTQNKDAQLANMQPLRARNQQQSLSPGRNDAGELQVNEQAMAVTERQSLSNFPSFTKEGEGSQRAVTPAPVTARESGSGGGFDDRQAKTQEPSLAASSPSTTLIEDDPKEFAGAASEQPGEHRATAQNGEAAYHRGDTQDTWSRVASDRIDQDPQQRPPQSPPRTAKRTPIQAPILPQPNQRPKQHQDVKSKFRQAADAHRPQMEYKKDYQKVISSSLSARKGAGASKKPTITEALASLKEVEAKQLGAKKLEFQKTQRANELRKQADRSDAKYRTAKPGQLGPGKAMASAFESRMLEADNRDGLRDAKQRHLSSVESPRNAYAANSRAYYGEEDEGSREQKISCVSQGENAEQSGERMAERSESPGPNMELNDSATGQGIRGARAQQRDPRDNGLQQYPQGAGRGAGRGAQAPLDHQQYDGSGEFAQYGNQQREQPYGGEVQFEPAYEAGSPAVPVEQQHSVESADGFQGAHDAADHTSTSGTGGAGPQAARPSRFSLQPIHEEEEFTPDRPADLQRRTAMPQAYPSSDEPLNLKLAPQPRSQTQNTRAEDSQSAQQSQLDTLALTVMHYNLIDDKTVAHSAIVQYIIDADPDVVGLSEVDTHVLYQDLKSSMSSLGYLDHCEAGADQSSCSAIFYKKAKLVCVETQLLQLGPDSSQAQSEHFLMYSRLHSTQDASHQLIFGNVQLPDVQLRAQAAGSVVKHFQTQFVDIPVVIGGDFDSSPAIPAITQQFTELGSLSGDEIAAQRRTIDHMYVLRNSWSQGLSNLSLSSRSQAQHEPSAYANAYPVALRFPKAPSGTELGGASGQHFQNGSDAPPDRQHVQRFLGGVYAHAAEASKTPSEKREQEA